MKLNELLESKFSVVYKHGRFKRTFVMPVDDIVNSAMFSHAEKKHILKLEPSKSFETHTKDGQGPITINVTRNN